MDSDQDGFISPDNFDLSGIPSDMLEYLEAILLEIHQSKTPTNFLNFVDIVENYNLFKDLDRVSSSLKLASVNPMLDFQDVCWCRYGRRNERDTDD
jgi:hypothetical protein